ncbi:MAG: BlaI/MecI/CopY family transcriptional regulator [Acidobacteriia bacterium]|nr:BlaI/MecI/CopY family transcriptional regulator [Terriglobia bacterium]
MPKAVRDVPPPLELLCLKALWNLEEGSVKEVRRLVAQTRPLAYTTIMTVLERLVRKGKLARRKTGRAFVYAPQESRDAMRRVAIQELLEGFFDGSEEELIRFLRRPEAQAAAAAAGGGASSTDDEERIDTVLL